MSSRCCQHCQEWKRGACLSCPDRHEDEREDDDEEEEDD